MTKISPRQYAISFYKGVFFVEKKQMNQVIDNFISILVENNDLKLLPKIIDEFNKYYKSENGEVDIDIISAFKLDDIQKEEIKKQIISKKIKKVNINNVISKDILGGMIIKYQDIVLDASVLNQTNNLKNFLIE